jgi:hypothetical protein
MDTSWIQIFILTLAECAAPAGKTVCQEQQFELQFLNRGDCEYALQQLAAMKDQDEQVIVNRQKSGCSPSAAESETYVSREAINDALQTTSGWRMPDDVDAQRAAVNKGHNERLDELKSCDETKGKAPCKVGEIIVEDAAGDAVDVWKRD